MDTTLDLAIVRNRLLAAKCDERDHRLLEQLLDLAGNSTDRGTYSRIVVWGISNALGDIKVGAYDSAAQNLDLVHNIRLLDGIWSPNDEAYFVKGVVATYMEHASVDRIKTLFSFFETSKVG